jgi:NADPH:quinone reductase-like Zn-dependent oxidoreductase
LDLAGTVTAVGAAVTRFSVGDEVYGFGKGPFAEYAAAHEDKIARKPANLTFEQASVVPVSASTALQALRAAGPITPGQKVLVLGASGGVGSYAVQLAKAAGAEVTGVCSTTKQDLVHSLGADHVIDYTRQDFADGSDRYDLILDIAGNPTSPGSATHLPLRELRSSSAGRRAVPGPEAWTGSSAPWPCLRSSASG